MISLGQALDRINACSSLFDIYVESSLNELLPNDLESNGIYFSLIFSFPNKQSLCRLMDLYILRKQRRNGERTNKGTSGRRNGGSITVVRDKRRNGPISGAASIQTLLWTTVMHTFGTKGNKKSSSLFFNVRLICSILSKL